MGGFMGIPAQPPCFRRCTLSCVHVLRSPIDDAKFPVIPPIKLQSVGKCYRIYKNPQDRFKQTFLTRWRRVMSSGERHPQTVYYREHWALRDVSFELQPGEALGILGRNGAGKSTLLQIIAGTLAATSGTVETNGRITALLELGSGFNPQFTGRENVFMNAAILGLSQEDTELRFGEIEAFADIGDFIDQPVNTYSSGMMMRLAFAVQTAVQPNVLIVDEALGVGDMFFQAKCMTRLRELRDAGVSLLFVSHDVGTVRQICQRAILLHEGCMVGIGSAADVADQYVKYQLEDRNKLAQSVFLPSIETRFPSEPELPIQDFLEPKIEIVAGAEPPQDNLVLENMQVKVESESFALRARFNRVGNRDAEITNVQMFRNGVHASCYDYDDEACILITVRFNCLLRNLNLAIIVRTLQGVEVLFQDTRLQEEMARSYNAGDVYTFEWRMRLPLMHGAYALSCGLAHPPEIAGQDWIFVDMVPIAYEFSMAPRAAGMIAGFVTLPAQLVIRREDYRAAQDVRI